MNRRLASIPLVLATACGTLGDRAATGGCPAGEICSPATPYGLYFEGPLVGDDIFPSSSLPRLATGGRITLHVQRRTWLFPEALTAFRATVEGLAATVERVAPPTVTLRGVAPGAASLRVLDPRSGELYDRVGLAVADVDRAELRPSLYGAVVAREPRGWVLFAGGAATLHVALLSAGGDRLVDEGMTLEGAGTRARWDTLSIAAVPAGGIDVTASSGGFRRTLHADAVDTIDDVAIVPSLVDAYADGKRTLCFRAYDRGRVVIGAPLRVDGPSGIVALGTPGATCATVLVPAGGSVDVTVRAGAYAEPFTIDGRAPAAKLPAAQPDFASEDGGEDDLPVPTGAPGERAAAAL